MKGTHTRRFLGKTEGFKNQEEQRFEQAHLKAYLRGYKRFKYGTQEITNAAGIVEVVPKWYNVKEELKPIKV